ncbi:hypothetical protein HMPREF9420_0911 [Segatella salivae DSM 15606]|uniref:Uncharacterized protein n=1 Tax=Segatella salivae DSM 15606 TaxID=888832 RepID=E6MN43_9BACT|nr:hypothetical protein HMPREF9420_0911 [Segatella salivae DSM 15606]
MDSNLYQNTPLFASNNAMICVRLLDDMTQMTNHFTIKTGCKKRQSSYSFDFQ